MDRHVAPLLVHEEAIYIHQGRQNQVDHLDWGEKKAYVTPVGRRLLHRRQSGRQARGPRLSRTAQERRPAGSRRSRARRVSTIFKKIKLRTRERRIGRDQHPGEEKHTTGYWLGPRRARRPFGSRPLEGAGRPGAVPVNIVFALPDVATPATSASSPRSARPSPGGRPSTSTTASPGRCRAFGERLFHPRRRAPARLPRGGRLLRLRRWLPGVRRSRPSRSVPAGRPRSASCSRQ